MPDETTNYLKAIEQALEAGNATEHTYRPALKAFVESLRPAVAATNEPKRVACGAPDYSVARDGLTIGYIEAKDIGRSLDEEERSEQLKRYRTLPNLILTDYLEFRWYVDGKRRATARLAREGEGGKLARDRQGREDVVELLRNFLDHAPQEIATPSELAERMARLTHEMRNVIIQAFEKKMASDMLTDLRESFARTLLPDLTQPGKAAEFADMYAQTLAYGLFAARANHRGPKGSFKRLGAASEIPKTNPFLRSLFETITGSSLNDEPYAGYVDDLVQLLANADMGRILAEFGKRAKQEDPVVHFYETFLATYDPKLREMRGVYYTPESVVSYIVRSVDHLLRERFGLADGLADTSAVHYEHRENGKEPERTEAPQVLILDPACGTGTFLYAVVDHIREQFKQQRNAGQWSGFVKDYLLPRLFGFELLMAPYAVAHLKLGMQLAGQDMTESQRKTWAYNFSGDERVNVFLTNTLDAAEKIAQREFHFIERDIAAEAAAANRIKAEIPVLVVLGNPPYSNFGRMNRNPWILGLLEDYKKGLKEKKLNLNDDFIKFIRWGQWRIQQTGTGILAFITNNTYIDGITHRRMRESLMETFTDIYVLDLHGSSKKKEKAPDGSKDENVFDIQQGVAIGIFVKEPGKSAPARFHHAELWGSQQSKYGYLLENDIRTTQWDKFKPNSDYCFFVPKNFSLKPEYVDGVSLKDVFVVHQNAVKTDRDSLFFDFDKERLEKRMELFYDDSGLSVDFRETYGIHDSSSYNLLDRRKRTELDRSAIVRCCYRPFDTRWLYYSPGLTSRPAWKVMRHVLPGDNLALIGMRQYEYDVPDYCYSFASRCITECRVFLSNRGIANIFPLYLYPDPAANGELFANGSGRHVNLKAEFIAQVEEKTGLQFIDDGTGDLEKTLGPEDVFHYIYAVFHSPAYRERYAEFLKIDFPRVPLTSDCGLFRRLCGLGGELVALHVMESPALANKITSFPVAGVNRMEKRFPKYFPPGESAPGSADPIEKGRVYINESQYFDGVPPEVWEFRVGGYQVCDKWLKDRRGRSISFDDYEHYCKIVVALNDTIRLMSEIDEAIASWPIQ